MRITIRTPNGNLLSRPGYQPQDENKKPITDYCDTFERAMEFVTER